MVNRELIWGDNYWTFIFTQYIWKYWYSISGNINTIYLETSVSFPSISHRSSLSLSPWSWAIYVIDLAQPPMSYVTSRHSKLFVVLAKFGALCTLQYSRHCVLCSQGTCWELSNTEVVQPSPPRDPVLTTTDTIHWVLVTTLTNQRLTVAETSTTSCISTKWDQNNVWHNNKTWRKSTLTRRVVVAGLAWIQCCFQYTINKFECINIFNKKFIKV